MSDSINRRTFLEGATAGGVMAGMALSTQAARAAESPANKVVVGVMGLSRGRALANGFAKQPGCEVKYVCDVDITRVGSAVKLLEGAGVKRPEAVTDFRKILDDKEVDALVCAAPNHWHAPATILGCDAGKHVYVEKPCCHNPHEGELMVQAARKHKRAVQMGSQRRSGPGTQACIEKLNGGVIGNVYLVRAYYANARGSLGHGKPAEVPSYLNYELWQGPAPRRPYLDNRIHYNWHWFWHWGNGELGNNGVHTLDLCRWGADVDFPIHVTSSGGRYCYDDDQQTPDTHTVCFEFEGGKQISWQGTSCHRRSPGFITFYGDKGAIELESNGTHTLFDEKNKEVERTPSPSLGDAEHLDNFLTAIRNDEPLSLNAEIEKGYKSTLLCHLGNIAQRTGRALKCDPASGRILDDAEAMTYWTRAYEPGWEPKV
jgi:predicted dehydrogenase